MSAFASKLATKALHTQFWIVVEGDDSMEAEDRLSAAAYGIGQLVPAGEIEDEHARDRLILAASLVKIGEEEAAGIIDRRFELAKSNPVYSTVKTSDPLVIDVGDWEGQEPPPMEWLLEGWIPMGGVTALFGDGGTGKSLLAQQLATCVYTGSPFLGASVRKGDVLGLLCEETPAELFRRQVKINDQLGLDMAALKGMRLMPRTTQDATLFRVSPKGDCEVTAFGKRFEAMCEGATLIIVDPTGIAYDGDENNRGAVYRFINWLTLIAMDNNAAVLFLGHPSLSGMSSDRGHSGSTSWSNAPRARAYLQHGNGKPDNFKSNTKTDTDSDGVDPAERILTQKKSNYGPRDAKFNLRWQEGAFVLSEPPLVQAGKSKGPSITSKEALFMAALREALDADPRPSHTKPGVIVTPVTQWREHAVSKFLIETEADGARFRTDFSRVQMTLQNKGLIKTGGLGKDLFAWLL